MPAIALPPSRRMAIALAVFRMRASILAPVVAVALCPRALGPGLVLAVVGIALPLCLLPTATSPALTVRSTAIHLMRDLWTRPECLAAARTPPVLHGGLSAQGNLSEAHPAPDAYNLDGEPNPANPRRPIVRTTTAPSRGRSNQACRLRLCGGSIPVSTPGSIPVSVKGAKLHCGATKRKCPDRPSSRCTH